MPNSIVGVAGHAPAVRKQDDAKHGPLGTIGNLRFAAREGGSPRLKPNAFNRIGQRASNLLGYLKIDSNARATHAARVKREAGLAALGDALGCMTAHGKINCTRAASALVRLGDLCNGRLANFPGGKDALLDHMKRLNYYDVNAIQTGGMRNAGARDAILELVPPAKREAICSMLAELNRQVDARQIGVILEGPVEDMVPCLWPGGAEGRGAEDAQAGEEAHKAKIQGALRDYLVTLTPPGLRAAAASFMHDKGNASLYLANSGQRGSWLSSELRQSIESALEQDLVNYSARLATRLAIAEPPPTFKDLMAGCENRTKALGYGDPQVVLLRALSLPEAVTGLRKNQVFHLLKDIPAADLSNLRGVAAESNELKRVMAPLFRDIALEKAVDLSVRLNDAISKRKANEIITLLNYEYANIARALIKEGDSTQAASQGNGASKFSWGLPVEMWKTFEDDFGIRFSRDDFCVEITVPETQQELFRKAIDRLGHKLYGAGADRLTRDFVYTVGERREVFRVDDVFYRDATRQSLTFDVKGRADHVPENLIEHVWDGGAPHEGELHLALSALFDLAGDQAALSLTKLMNQLLSTELQETLSSLGSDTPFRLANGRAGQPGGSMDARYSIEKLEDGDFSVRYVGRVKASNMVELTGPMEFGNDFTSLNPDHNWYEIRLDIAIDSNFKRAELTGAPVVRYSF